MTTCSNQSTTPVLRHKKHERRVVMQGFLRDDGLWDIEGRMQDVRTYDSLGVERGQIAAGNAIHEIRACLTVNDELIVLEARAFMAAVPFETCPSALAPVSALKGSSMGPGWRKSVESTLGGDIGCTHIRELLMQLATTAYQTIPVWNAQRSGDVVLNAGAIPPRHLGTCRSWSFGGPVVQRIYPQFVNWNSRVAEPKS